VLVLSAAEVRALLDLDELVEALRVAMIELSAGRVSAPPRVAALVPEHDAMLAAMPAYLPSAGALASKLVSLFPGNRDQPTHQALICCFDPATGTPAAVMDGGYLTAARTAGGSALATRLLARPDAGDVTVVGTGVQAGAHARALARLPGWSRSGDSITTTVELEDFRAAMLYTGAVAYLADTANHHPDVLIQWNKVTLTLSTHSAGGLTSNDTALAERINALR